MGIGGANWWKCSQFPAVSITFTFFCWPARNNWPSAAGIKTEIWRRSWFFAIYFDNLDIDITYWHWQAVRGQDYSLTNVLLVHHQIEIWFSSVKMVSWQWLIETLAVWGTVVEPVSQAVAAQGSSSCLACTWTQLSTYRGCFLDAIASPSTYPGHWVSQWVSE